MVYHSSSEESSQEESEPKNIFRNDGSFLEMFKKMQETSASSSSSSSSSASSQSSVSSTSSLPCVKDKTSITSISDSIKTEDKEKVQSSEREGKPLNNKFPIFGKRRGGKVLPTGKVKKVKVEPKEEQVEDPKDAWSQYLAEVKKYKETTCEEEGKTRPLVK